MESTNVELQLTGGHDASGSGSTESPARLAALGYTFTTTGGARR
jgi:hypothetical protein